MSSPDSVRELVRRAKENGFTDLIVQVRGRGDAYYESNIEPRAEALTRQPSDFDPLALTIEEAHREGIKVHAWINIYLVADLESLPTSRDHPIFRHPEWVMVPRGIATELYDVQPDSGAYLDRIIEFSRLNHNELEGLFVSPAHPGVKDNLLDIWMDIARRYEVDGLHFDYVRYPNPQYDYSRVSIDRFRQEIEKADPVRASRAPGRVPARPAPIRKEVPGGLRRVPTRAGDRSRVANLQRSQKCQAERDHFGGGLRQRRGRRAFSLRIGKSGCGMDRSTSSARWLTPDTADFRKQLVTAMNLASGKRVWSGIGAYKQTAESAIEKIRAARDLGAQGFILFSYDSSIKVSDLNPQEIISRSAQQFDGRFGSGVATVVARTMRLGAKIIFQRLATEDLMRVKRPFLRPSTQNSEWKAVCFRESPIETGRPRNEIPSDGL